MRLLCLDPFDDSLFEQNERHWPVVDQCVVELVDVELCPQRRGGPLAQVLDSQLAELVAECLAWPDDVAVDFRDDLAFGETAVLGLGVS